MKNMPKIAGSKTLLSALLVAILSLTVGCPEPAATDGGTDVTDGGSTTDTDGGSTTDTDGGSTTDTDGGSTTDTDGGSSSDTDGGSSATDAGPPPPACTPDVIEPNDTAGDSAYAGLGGIDTASDFDPETDGVQSIPLNLCDGDVDYFAIQHMGGALGVDVSGVGGDAPTFEVLNATVALNADDLLEYTEGAAATLGDLPRGAYLLKVNAATVPETGLDYSFAVTHACEGDDSDYGSVDFDDQNLRYAGSVAYGDSIEQTLCAGDSDGFAINNLIAGTTTLTLTGGAGFSAEVFTFTLDDDGIVEDANGDPIATPYTTGVATADAGNDFTVTLTDAPVGYYFVKVAGGTVTADLDYVASVSFAAFDNPPANDACAGNVTLEMGADAVTGQTISATSTLNGPEVVIGIAENDDEILGDCTGVSQIPADSDFAAAGEVFYHMNIAADIDVQIEVDGEENGFRSAVYVLEFDGTTCPADLSTLPAFQLNDAPLCSVDSKHTLRIPAMPAGDYLVVVDGIYDPGFAAFGIPDSITSGIFTITANSFAEGFPPPQACTDATTAAIPTAATPTVLNVDLAGASAELESDCGGGGAERIFSLTPTADVTLNITAGGEEQFDTVVYLMEGACTYDAVLVPTEEAGTCNDDDPAEVDPVPNFGSALSVSLTANTEYYLVVDAYSATEGTATVTLTVAN